MYKQDFNKNEGKSAKIQVLCRKICFWKFDKNQRKTNCLSLPGISINQTTF